MNLRTSTSMRLSLAFAAFACVTAAQAAGTRQLCRFPDGEQRVVYQELAATFGMAVSDCRTLPPVAANPRDEALRWSDIGAVPHRGFEDVDINVGIRTIQAPAARRSWAMPSARVPSVAPAEYQRLIATSARRNNVDPQIVEAVMYVESRFQPNAQSNKGALGLMQLMPQTAQQYGVSSPSRLFDPATNIECGTRYLSELTTYFAGRLDLAIAAYNAGPAAVVRHGWRVPPFAETQAYVERVLQRMRGGQ